MNNAPIGIYDSGMGGLSIHLAVRQRLPREELIYLGDGKNCPYGSRSREEVARLADEAVAHLVAMGCKLVVVACNTATAAAIEALRAKYAPMPIVGMEPAIKPACLRTQSRVVGVLATERSLDGELFRRTAARYGADIEVLTAVGDGFVELVEEGREATPEAVAQVAKVLQPMLDRGADEVVLGCTHYPFLLDALHRAANGAAVHFIDPSEAVARRVEQLLDAHDLRCDASHEGSERFVTFADEAYRKRLEERAQHNL